MEHLELGVLDTHPSTVSSFLYINNVGAGVCPHQFKVYHRSKHAEKKTLQTWGEHANSPPILDPILAYSPRPHSAGHFSLRDITITSYDRTKIQFSNLAWQLRFFRLHAVYMFSPCLHRLSLIGYKHNGQMESWGFVLEGSELWRGGRLQNLHVWLQLPLSHV